jgi:hypothetical protein
LSKDPQLAFKPWTGAVPDTDKLAARIQVDEGGLWWKGSKCDKCEYEAAIYLGETGEYLCWEHRFERGKGSK